MEVFQRLVGMADIQAADSPEEVARLRGALFLEHQRRLSLALQRGNARIIIGRSRQSRDRMGLRVYAPSFRTELDFGSGT